MMTPSTRFAALARALACFTVLVLDSYLGWAQPHARSDPSGAESALSPEADLHFRRAIQLATEHSELAALVEFRRAYELSRNSLIRFNIAAVEIELSRYDEGLASLDAYVRDAPADVVRSRRAQLDSMRARIMARSGVVRTPLTARGVRLELESVGTELRITREEESARAGVRVPVGRYRVRVSAPGHRSRERELDVASDASITLDEPLEPTETTLTVRSNVDDADVLVDGRNVGRTPLGRLHVSEGIHRIEVVRAGYSRFEISALTQGTVSTVAANLLWLRGLHADVGGRFLLDREYRDVECAIDGERVACDGTEVVPPGRHLLRVTGRDYVTLEQPVDLPVGRIERVHARLAIRPEAQRESLEQRWAQRRAGLIVGGLGLAAGVVSAGWLTGLITSNDTSNDTYFSFLTTVGGCTGGTPAMLTVDQAACVRSILGASFPYALNTPAEVMDALITIDSDRSGSAFILGAAFATTVVSAGAAIVGLVIFMTAPADRFAIVPPRRPPRIALVPTLSGFAVRF